MSIYGDLCFVDILEPIRGKYKIDFTPEGEPKVELKPVLGIDSPWISTMPKIDRMCTLWMAYFYNYNIISRTCRRCFKVAMEVNTLDELFRVLDYQRDNKDNCKCGVEKRAFTGRLGKYSAFWYAPIDDGLDGAKKLYKRISKEFSTMKCILKRGCTEFEMTYYPSNTWDTLAERNAWDAKENLLDQLFVLDPVTIQVEMNTPKMLEVHIIKKWIEWAFEHNDMTYLNYTDRPFKQELMDYTKGGNDASIGSTGTEVLGDNRLDDSSDEDSRKSPGRKASIIQGLPEDE